jgi:glycosyltransferase involved in cell wall biosynthesis
MTLLSIIVPTYNSEATIERCLDSIALQTFSDFEVCIIDGGSTDRTIEIVNCFQDILKNLRVTSESDKGIYDAMNKGISSQ